MNLLQTIIENYYDVEFLKADGLDEAVIGVDYASDRLIYSVRKILGILMQEHEMSLEEAEEYFQYNIGGAYVGEKTPIYCHDNFFL